MHDQKDLINRVLITKEGEAITRELEMIIFYDYEGDYFKNKTFFIAFFQKKWQVPLKKSQNHL